MNQWLVVSREVRDRSSNEIVVQADYSELGVLLILVTVIGTLAPLLAIVLVKASRWKPT